MSSEAFIRRGRQSRLGRVAVLVIVMATALTSCEESSLDGTDDFGGELFGGGGERQTGGTLGGAGESPSGGRAHSGGGERSTGGASGGLGNQTGGAALGGEPSAGGHAHGGVGSGPGTGGRGGEGGEAAGHSTGGASLGGSGPVGSGGAASVNGCTVFQSRTGPGDDRSLNWNFSIATDPERCIEILVGQSVTWNGNFGFHPLRGAGGTVPNVIPAHESGDGEFGVSFSSPGVYGFICDAHVEMRGAVRAVEAN